MTHPPHHDLLRHTTDIIQGRRSSDYHTTHSDERATAAHPTRRPFQHKTACILNLPYSSRVNGWILSSHGQLGVACSQDPDPETNSMRGRAAQAPYIAIHVDDVDWSGFRLSCLQKQSRRRGVRACSATTSFGDGLRGLRYVCVSIIDYRQHGDSGIGLNTFLYPQKL